MTSVSTTQPDISDPPVMAVEHANSVENEFSRQRSSSTIGVAAVYGVCSRLRSLIPLVRGEAARMIASAQSANANGVARPDTPTASSPNTQTYSTSNMQPSKPSFTARSILERHGTSALKDENILVPDQSSLPLFSDDESNNTPSIDDKSQGSVRSDSIFKMEEDFFGSLSSSPPLVHPNGTSPPEEETKTESLNSTTAFLNTPPESSQLSTPVIAELQHEQSNTDSLLTAIRPTIPRRMTSSASDETGCCIEANGKKPIDAFKEFALLAEEHLNETFRTLERTPLSVQKNLAAYQRKTPSYNLVAFGLPGIDTVQICVNFARAEFQSEELPVRIVCQIASNSFVNCSLCAESLEMCENSEMYHTNANEKDSPPKLSQPLQKTYKRFLKPSNNAIQRLSWADGVVVCFDRTSRESFNISVDFVLNVLRIQTNSTPVVLVGVLKSDSQKPINFADESTNIGVEYFEINMESDPPLLFAYPFGFLMHKVREIRQRISMQSNIRVSDTTFTHSHSMKQGIWGTFDPTPPLSVAHAIDDILEFEVQYRNELTVGVQAVKNALVGAGLSEKQILGLFGNMPMILELHQNLLMCIDHFLGSPVDIREVMYSLGGVRARDEVFGKFPPIRTIEQQKSDERSIIHFIATMCLSCSIYKDYMNNFVRTARATRKALKNNKVFTQVVSAIESSDIMASPSLKDLLMLPCFRLNILFEQFSMLQFILPWSPEKLLVRIALSTVRVILRDRAHEIPRIPYHKDSKDFKNLFTEIKGSSSTERVFSIQKHLHFIMNTFAHPVSWDLRYRVFQLTTSIVIILKGNSLNQDNTKQQIFETIVKYGQFILRTVSLYFRRHQEFKKNLVDAVTELTISSVYAVLYPEFKKISIDNDIIIRKRLNEFITATPSHFSIRKKYYTNDKSENDDLMISIPFEKAIENMTRVNKSITPSQKCKALLETADAVANASSADISADELLPIYAYVIVKSQNPNPYSDCMYIEYFLNSNESMGKEGYILTTFQSALAFLSAHTLERLSVEGNQNFADEQSRALRASCSPNIEESKKPKKGFRKTLSRIFK